MTLELWHFLETVVDHCQKGTDDGTIKEPEKVAKVSTQDIYQYLRIKNKNLENLGVPSQL